jgi:hypothetical protein
MRPTRVQLTYCIRECADKLCQLESELELGIINLVCSVGLVSEEISCVHD